MRMHQPDPASDYENHRPYNCSVTVLCCLLIAAYWLCHTGYVLRMDPLPVHDSATYLEKSLNMYQSLSACSLRGLIDAYLYAPMRLRPPVHPFRATLLLPDRPGLFSRVLISNLLILSLSVLFIYILARRKGIRHCDALPGAVLFLGFPLTHRMFLTFWSETTLLLLLSILLYLSALSPSRKTSLALGLTFSLGFLTKFTFIVFAVPVALYYLAKVYSQRRYTWLAWCAIPALIVLIPWLAVNGSLISDNILLNLYQSPDRPYGSGISLSGLFWYVSQGDSLLSFPLLALLLPAVISGLVKKKPIAWYLLFLITVFSFIPHKETRHIFPVLPFLGMTIVDFPARIRYRNMFIPVLLVIAMLNILASFCGIPLWSGEATPIRMESPDVRMDVAIRVRSLPHESRDLHYRQIVESLIPYLKDPTRVAFASIDLDFNGETFSYFSHIETQNRSIRVCYYVGYSDGWINCLCDADFVIMRSDVQTLAPEDPLFAILEKTAWSVQQDTVISGRFELLSTIALDGRASILIFRRSVASDDLERARWTGILGDSPVQDR